MGKDIDPFCSGYYDGDRNFDENFSTEDDDEFDYSYLNCKNCGEKYLASTHDKICPSCGFKN